MPKRPAPPPEVDHRGLPPPTPGLQVPVSNVRGPDVPGPFRRRHRAKSWRDRYSGQAKLEGLFDRADIRVARRSVGRPTKLTKQLVADLVFLLEEGAYLEPAAFAVGITPSTLFDWLAKGRSEPPHTAEHRFFSEAVDAAVGSAEVRLMLDSKLGGPKGKASAFVLERRFPGKWGRRLAITGADGAPPTGVQVYGVRLPKDDDEG